MKRSRVYSALVATALILAWGPGASAQDPDVPLETAPELDGGGAVAPLPEDAPAETSVEISKPIVSKPAKTGKTKKARKPSRRKKNKKKKKPTASLFESGSRGIASVGGGEVAYVVPVAAVPVVDTVPVVETETYGETTSFEQMVRTRRAANRGPAALKAAARVIAVRRELGLTRAQADQAPQDIILNGGTKAGLEKGMHLSIVRRVPILDPYRENQQSEIEVAYGKVKILHVQDDIAVARIDEIDSIREGIGLGVRGPLVGDFVASK